MDRPRKIKLSTQNNHQWDNTFWTIPGWDPKKIREAKVMIVGAGALGNEVVKNLTLLNVGQLVIVDFDIVEYDNLAKSILFRKEDKGKKKALAMANNLKEVNSGIKTLPVVGDISTDVGLGVFRRMDVVIGCLDNRLARLFINRHCHKVGKTWIDGALENLAGRFSVFTPGISCFECNLPDEARDIIQFRMGCPDIAKRNASNGVIATTPISSSIIGAFQVQEALKIIFGSTENSMAGEAFQYNGKDNFYLKYKTAHLRPDCDSHVHYEEIVEAGDLSHTMTVGEILDWMSDRFNIDNPKILVDEDIVIEALASKSGKACHPVIYKNHLFESPEVLQLERAADEDLFISKKTCEIDRSFPYPDKTLKEIGIPFLEILKVEAEDNFFFVELTGDEDKLKFS